MSSSLFQRFGQYQQERQNRFDSLITGVKEFQKTFTGDPQERLQSLISSGRVPQDVLNRAQEQALPIYKAMRAITGK